MFFNVLIYETVPRKKEEVAFPSTGK